MYKKYNRLNDFYPILRLYDHYDKNIKWPYLHISVYEDILVKIFI